MIQFLNAATGTATTAEMLLSFLPMILIIVFMIILIETGSDRTKIRFRRSAISSVEKLDTGKDSKSTPVKK